MCTFFSTDFVGLFAFDFGAFQSAASSSGRQAKREAEVEIDMLNLKFLSKKTCYAKIKFSVITVLLTHSFRD